MKKAFSLLELVFVVLILGILAAIITPKLSSHKDETKILKARMDYELLNSSLSSMRSEFKLKQISTFTQILDEAKINLENQKLFSCELSQICTFSALENHIISSLKGWMKTGDKNYRFYINSKKFLDFYYDEKLGSFECAGTCEEF